MPYQRVMGPRDRRTSLCGARKQWPDQEHECVCVRALGHAEHWHRCDNREHSSIGAWTGGDYPGRPERIEV